MSITATLNKAIAGVAAKPEALVTKACQRCEKSFEMMQINSLYFVKCPECERIIENEIVATMRQQRIATLAKRWETLCPLDYQTIDRDKLPNVAAHDQAMRSSLSAKGLVLHGEPNRGKTRTAWAILGREQKNGKSVAVLDSMAGLHWASKCAESMKIAEQWIEKLVSVDVLLMDDVFKVKLTDSFEGVIFTIVDKRIAERRPIIVTSNDTGDTLANRMTPDRAKPLLWRLRLHCTQIKF